MEQLWDGVDIKQRHYKIISTDKFQKKYVGMIYDKLTALSPVIITDPGVKNYEGYRSWWLFQCDCGNKICSTISVVKHKNKIHSCGCHKKQRRLDKYVGQTFNYLTIVDLDENFKKDNNIKSDAGYYKCKCVCGNYKTVRLNTLQSGEVKSCGCLKQMQDKINLANGALSTLIDLTGQQFGLLTVLKKTDYKAKDGTTIWECQCQCGNIIYRRGDNLRHTSHSCGCESMSDGERKIAEILRENKVDFLYNTSYFKDLFTSENGIGRYDFIILDNKKQPIRLIEFDGMQHFKPIKFFGGQSHLEESKRRDAIKNNYAKKNNIPLVRIPYYEQDNITLEMLMSNKYLVT